MRASTVWGIAVGICVGCGGAQRTSEPVSSEPQATEQPAGEAGRVEQASADDEAPPHVAERAAPEPLVPVATCDEGTLDLNLAYLQQISRSPYLAVDRAALPQGSADAASPGNVLGSGAPILTITENAVLFDGAPIEGADDAARARAIATAYRAASRRTPRPTALYVAAPGATALDRVRALVGSIRNVQLLVLAAPRAAASFAASPWGDEIVSAIDAAAPDARCAIARDALDRAAGTCDAARAPLRALVDTTPTCTATVPARAGMQESIAAIDALHACHCGGADTTAIAAIYRRAADRAENFVRGFPLEGDMYSAPPLDPLENLSEEPTTVLERVRILERQRDPRGH